MRSQKILFAATTMVALTVSILAGCKKHKDNPTPPPPPPPPALKTSYVEVVHASPRTADIDVKIDTTNIAGKIKYLDKPAAYLPVKIKDSVTIQLSASGAVIARGVHRLQDKYKYTIFVYDTLDAAKKVKYLLMQDAFSSPASGKCNVRFLHLAPQLTAVDVDMFAGKDSIRLASAYPYSGTKTPDGKFSQIKAGEYRIRVKSGSGAASAVVLDIPSVKLEKGSTFSLYLCGLVKGTGDNRLGLQLMPHK
jgi:hypothetical protein